MSEEKALIPLEQKTIDFYGDEIIAVLVTTLPTFSGELLVTPQPTPRLGHKRSVRARECSGLHLHPGQVLIHTHYTYESAHSSS